MAIENDEYFCAALDIRGIFAVYLRRKVDLRVKGGRQEMTTALKATAAVDVTALIAEFTISLQASPATKAAYLKGVRQFGKWCTANAVTALTREVMLAYREFLNDKVTADDGYSPRTANLYLTSARKLTQFLHDNGYIPTDVGANLKGFAVDNTTHAKDSLDVTGVRKMLSTIDTATLAGKRNRAVTALMSCCGLRCCEVVRANVEDLKLKSGVVQLHVQGKGKLDKAATVNVPSYVVRFIREYLDARGAVPAHAPLFASLSRNNLGGRLSTTTVSQIVKRALLNAGYNDGRLTAHSLRHTAATLAIKSGATLREVQHLLRHKSVSTSEIYLHDLEQLENRAANLAAAAIFGEEV